jgi:hypothetical protein
MHAKRLEHRTHWAAGDDTGTGWSCAENDLTSAVATSNVMMQCPAFAQRHADQRALCGFRCLPNGFWDFAGLAVTEANATLLIANDDEGCEAEATTTLHHFGNAVDMDEPIHEFRIALFAILTLSWFSCHVGLLLKTRARFGPARFEK